MTYMKQIYHYYQENITAYTKRIALLSKKIHLLGTIRLVLILLLFINIWIFKSGSAIVLASTSISILLIFAYLMYLHTKLSNEKEYFETLCKLNKDELNGLDYDFRAFEDYDSSEKMKESHPYCLDLDIFGEKSLFQSINRTVTAGGKEYLANSFLHPLNDKNDILERQEAIKELSQAVQWRQHFYATGKTCSRHKMQTVELSKLLHIQPFFSESRMWKLWMLLIPFGWIALGVACLFNLIPTSVFGIYVIIAGAFAYAKSKKVNDLYNTADKTEKILLTYSELIKSIEQQTFQATALQRISNGLFTNKLSASTHIKRLSSLIGGLNQRFSLAGILLNILYLRDTRHALRLEQWVKDHAGDTSAWLNILFEIDAYCSLAGFAFNHPDETLIIVTGDHETGGMTIGYAATGYNTAFALLRNQKCSFVAFDEMVADRIAEGGFTFEVLMDMVNENFGLAAPGETAADEALVMNDYEYALLQRAYDDAMSGNTDGYEESLLYGGYNPISVTLTHIINNKAGIGWTSYFHTGLPVPVYAYGEGAEAFIGSYDNTQVALRLMDLTDAR